MQHIIVGVDGSPQADRALRWAVSEAQLRLAIVDLVHCYVVSARGVVLHAPEREQAEAQLDEIVERNRDVLDRVKWTSTTMGVFSTPSAGLVEAAEDGDLIVLGARGTGGFRRLRLGSTSYRTASHATSPVAVIHPDEQAADDARRPLVVGIDDSRGATRALRWATDEAERRGVALTVVHAYQPPPEPAMLGSLSPASHAHALDSARDAAQQVVDDMVDAVAVAASVSVERVIEHGTAAEVLLARAADSHLLVVGTHGRGALGRLAFGSVSHQCLHHATGPVVVVP